MARGGGKPHQIYEIANLEVRHTNDPHTRLFGVPGFPIRVSWFASFGFVGI